MSNEMELAIILLNWNAADDTLRCLEYIAAWKRAHPAIWVVDNASTDGSADLIAREWPKARLIRNEINVGYAGGNNQALSEILDQGISPILFLNNDARIDEADLIRLMQTLQRNPQIGLLGPLLFDAENPERLLTAGGQNLIRHLTSHISKVRTNRPLQIVDYVPGTVLLCRAEVFQRVGLLDETYFFSGELPDLGERVKGKGFLSAIDTQARAYHTLSRSSSFRETLYTYYIIRNRFRFIRKFCKFSKLFFYGFWTLYSLALAVKTQFNGKPNTAKAIRLGLFDGLRGRFGGQNERVLTACAKNGISQLKPDSAGQQP